MNWVALERVVHHVVNVCTNELYIRQESTFKKIEVEGDREDI